MKKIIFLILITNFLLLIPFCAGSFGQSQFQYRMGGAGSDDGAYSIIRTTDGGYAIAGRTNSVVFGAGGDDMYIIKLNAAGTLQWSRTVGTVNNDVANCIVQTTDGGYVVAGETTPASGYPDMFIVKLSSSGSLQWSKTVGGTYGDEANSIIQTTDGGYIVAGSTASFGAGSENMFIVKLSSSGSLQWSKAVGETFDVDEAYSIIQTSDGGYVAAGSRLHNPSTYTDMYMVKLNSSGSFLWSTTTGGSLDDAAYSIIQTADGGFAVAGSYGSASGISDMYFVKYNSGGTSQWGKAIGATGNDYANSVIQTSDGGYILAGGSNSFGGGNYDMYIVKISSTGTIQWKKTVGGTGDDYANSIVQTTDGGFAAAGYTNSFGATSNDIYIAKLDASGNTCGNSSSPTSFTASFGTTTSPTPTLTSPTPTVTTLTPSTNSGGVYTMICVIGIKPISNEIPASYKLHQNYPNPFNPNTSITFSLPKRTHVELTIYDALGREAAILANEEINPGIYKADWDASNYPSGVYFYTITAGDFSQTKKMVLLK